jgi:hypothetical protein
MTKRKAPYNSAVESEVLREHQRVLIDLARYATEDRGPAAIPR